MPVTKKIETAMILAAGRGERLRPITDHLPKPLVDIGGETLLQRHLQALQDAGVRRIVINVAYLPEQIVAAVQAMPLKGVEVLFSEETGGSLETAGGLLQALPILDTDNFLVVNADIWTDFDFVPLLSHTLDDCLAHLVMVDTPAEKPAGDFYLNASGMLNIEGDGEGLTFSGISVMSRGLLEGLPPGRQALRPVLESAIAKSKISAEHFSGRWYDVGTPEKLDLLRKLQA